MGCSRCLEQSVHIEVITESVGKLIDNVEYGVIEVAVYLCGQTVGNLKAGNGFELFYEYFKGGNFGDCIDQVLCFEVVGKIIAGYSFNVREKNLCIARSESLVVYLAKGCGIDCIKNCNDLFKSQFLCKRDEIIGGCFASGKDLILKCVEFGIGGISHLFQRNAQNACELGGNGDIRNQLAVNKSDGADLIHQNGELSSCCANGIGACGENEAEVDSLGLLYAFFIVVGDRKGSVKQLAAIVDACKLVKSGNEVLKCIEQLCGNELDVAALVLRGDNNTVNFNCGDGLLHGCKNIEHLNEILVKVEHINKLLENTGVVDRLNQLLNVNLGNNGIGANCLNKTCNVNDIGNGAILQHFDSNGLNTNELDDRVEVGHVTHNGGVAAGDSSDSGIYADRLNGSGVILKARYDVGYGEGLIADSGGDLGLDGVNVNECIVAVYGCKCIHIDNVSGDQLTDYDNVIVQKLLNVQNAVGDQVRKVGEQRRKHAVAEQKDLNVDGCGVGAVAAEKLVVQINENAVCNHSVNVNGRAVYVFYELTCYENAVVDRLSDDCFRCCAIHVVSKLILNTVKHTGKNALVNVCGDSSGETVNVCIHKSIERNLVNVVVSQGGVADSALNVGQVCGCLNVYTVELNRLVKINDVKEVGSGKTQCKVDQLGRIVIDQLASVDVRNSLLNSAVVDVAHQEVNVLNVALQIDILKECYEACGIYASKQSIYVETLDQCFGVDIGNDRLCKVDQLLLGKDRKELFLGHNAAKAAGGVNALEQSLQVAILKIG